MDGSCRIKGESFSGKRLLAVVVSVCERYVILSPVAWVVIIDSGLGIFFFSNEIVFRFGFFNGEEGDEEEEEGEEKSFLFLLEHRVNVGTIVRVVWAIRSFG